jgi:hypothetical protein
VWNLRKIHWVLSTQLGLDLPRAWRSVKGVLRYTRDWREFRRSHGGTLGFRPCLSDWGEEGGVTKSEYFWQDLHVAKKIHSANPGRHVDIGSRIDGFVAHLASFRSVEVFDIRPIRSEVPGIVFRQADLMQLPSQYRGYSDSVSCLHALEHFGLGRYGDPIDPEGHVRGLTNIASIVCDGGRLYLSAPVGKPHVEFNAHRICDPFQLVQVAALGGLALEGVSWFDDRHGLQHSESLDEDLRLLAAGQYALAIFTFCKRSDGEVGHAAHP